MTEKSRGEAFETYPYPQPDPLVAESESPAAPAHPPALPEPLNPVGEPTPPKINRRKLVVSSIGAGLAGLFGYSVLRWSQGEGSGHTDGEELPPEDGDWIDDSSDDDDDLAHAALETSYGELGCEVPVGWRVVSEGDQILISHDSGSLAARVPERRSAGSSDVAREADQLRDTFAPDDKPATFADESDTRFTVVSQTRSGHLGGKPATEVTTLLVNREGDQTLVMSWSAVPAESDIAAQARSMARELRRGFEDS